jgi:ParB/RepB/Spo0J family partition protein
VSITEQASFTKPLAPAALVPPKADDRLGQRVMIKLSLIDESPYNTRQVFAGIDELAASIAEVGLLEDLLVRPSRKTGRFELVAGARRLRALQKIKAEEASCKLRWLSDADARAANIIENLQRENINPAEEAEAFKQLHDQDPKTWTPQAIAKKVGKTDRFVQQRLAIAGGLTAPLKKKFAEGELTVEVARTLAPLPAALQSQLQNDWSVEQGNADQVRRRITQIAIPFDAAKFDVKLYDGDVLEEGKKRYFLDLAKFRKLQTPEAQKVVERLKAEWPGVKLIERDETSKWFWGDATATYYGHIGHSERKSGKPSKYTVPKDKCTAVVWIDETGRIRTAEGVATPAAVDAASRKRQASTSSGPREAGEKKEQKAARLAFNARLAKALAAKPDRAMRVLLFRLLYVDEVFDLAYHEIKKSRQAALPKTLHKHVDIAIDDSEDDNAGAEAWAAILKLSAAQVSQTIVRLVAGGVSWQDWDWKTAPSAVLAIGKSVGVEPAKVEEKTKAKPKAAPKAKKAARK